MWCWPVGEIHSFVSFGSLSLDLLPFPNRALFSLMLKFAKKQKQNKEQQQKTKTKPETNRNKYNKHSCSKQPACIYYIKISLICGCFVCWVSCESRWNQTRFSLFRNNFVSFSRCLVFTSWRHSHASLSRVNSTHASRARVVGVLL